ncbi:MAG: hypothetical protein WC303_02525 [Candidatus Paceibacterota bacterium]|jgi:hypothetical protein
MKIKNLLILSNVLFGLLVLGAALLANGLKFNPSYVFFIGYFAFNIIAVLFLEKIKKPRIFALLISVIDIAMFLYFFFGSILIMLVFSIFIGVDARAICAFLAIIIPSIWNSIYFIKEFFKSKVSKNIS